MQQELPCQGTRIPACPVQHLMIAGEADMVGQTHHPEHLGDGAFAGRQHRAGHQHQDVLPGRGGEIRLEHGEPAEQHRRDQRGGGVTGRMRLHPRRRVETQAIRKSPATTARQFAG
jgi:hypothetical protein